MEGLDASILNLSEVRNDNEKFRIDNGFFGKLAVFTQKRVEALPHIRLGIACSTFRKGIFDIKADSYVESGIPFVRIGDLKGGLIDDSDLTFISETAHAEESATALVRGDVILSKTAYAAASLVNLPRCNVSQDTIAVQIASTWKKKLFAGYLVAYLNTKHGMALMERQFQGNVQAHLSLPDGRKLPVPLFLVDFQKRVHETLLEADQQLGAARDTMSSAEQTLLQALGLKNWQPPELLTYTRHASEALAAERFDSEYFQPKFAALITKMKKGGEVVRLGDCLRFCERGRQPAYAEEGLPVINSRHVRTNNVVLDEDNRFATEDAAQLKLDEEYRFTIKQGDLLINGTGVGTMGRCAPYLREGKALPDNHVTILRMKPEAGIDPVFLSIQLNSIIGQMQVDQYFKGSSGQIELYPGDIKEFRIWRAPQQIQQQIKANLDQAHAARQQAQALLAKAKRAVEVAIEEGEEKAMEFIQS